MKNLMLAAAGLLAAATLSFTLGRSNQANILKPSSATDTGNHTVRLVADNPEKEMLKDLHLYYQDSFAHVRMPGMAGNEAVFILNTPTILIKADAKQTPFLVYPGEKVFLRYTKTDSLQLYIPFNEQRTRELDFFRQLVLKTGNVMYMMLVMPYQGKVSTLDALRNHETTINDVKNARLHFLQDYAARYPLSQSFVDIAAHGIRCTALNDSLLLYFYNKPFLTKQGSYQTLVDAKIPALQIVGFTPDPFFAHPAIGLVSMALGNGPTNAVAKNAADLTNRFNYIQKNFTGKIRTFLWAHTIYAATFNGVVIPKTMLQTFYTQSGDAGYNASIAASVKGLESERAYPPGTNQLMSRDGKTVQPLDCVLAKYKNKVVVLDFWASWCAPCRGEMPSSLLLQKQYAGKNVAFVTLSTDANTNDWQKAAREEGLNPADSYLLLNSQRAPFTKRYQINSIPRYMLVGKDGKIINANAPRPSEPELKDLIDKYL